MEMSITKGKLTENKHCDESLLSETLFVIKVPEKLHNFQINRQAILLPFQPPFTSKGLQIYKIPSPQ
jgi:hypothetical protein